MASTRDELFAAIGSGDVRTVASLLDAEPALASARDEKGVTALMRARYRFDRALTHAILAAGPELDVFEAASFGDIDRLTVLLHTDPALIAERSPDGFAALHLSAFFGKPDAARLLLAEGADVDVRGNGWMTGTPLHSAASGNHTDVALVLLEAGADPDARQSGGWTPLHSAAHNGNASFVDVLLRHTADPTAIDDDGRSVLDLAEESADADTIARLRAELPSA